jgi:alkylation response protein AidB-like acyl-CoA dehydrogenase
VLARTNGDGKKQEGISFLLADIKNTPGITVKPFLTTGGTDAFSETWFKDARVPQTNRVGPENGGWAMAKALLGHERTSIGGVAESGKWLARVKRLARNTPVGDGTLLDDAAFRRRIARLELRYRAVELANLRMLAAAQLGRAPGAESSILKIVGTELHQQLTELAMDAMGHDAMGWFDSPGEALPEGERWVASQFNYLRANTIYGGSNEIQKNIIAKQILGLPTA